MCLYVKIITCKKTFAYTSVSATPSSPTDTVYYGYTNAWGDLMMSYDGVSITYDEIGNPLSYYNGASYTFTWEKGRRLSSATKGTSVTTFEYNEDGIRTSKTVNGVEHIYYLNGSQILAEVWGNNICIYLYDESGAPIGMRYRNSTYAEAQFDTFWYTKNLQGDIVGVYNDEGVLVRSYVYDAWGVVKTTIHNNTGTNANSSYNPFFYRGYYYDIQLGLYYLNSRYYDPATCRFISPDGYISTGQGFTGYNMYAYCLNSPISFVDENGEKCQLLELVKKVTKYIVNDYVEPRVDEFQENMSKYNGTVTQGNTTSVTSGLLSGSAQFAQSVDTKGNVAYQITFGGSFGLGEGFSLSHSNNTMITNAPDVFALNKLGTSVGFSLNLPVYKIINALIGIDFNQLYNLPSLIPEYFGVTFSMGASLAANPSIVEAHVSASYTFTVFSFNVYEELENVFDAVRDW